MNLSSLLALPASTTLAARESYRGLSKVELVEARPVESLVRVLATTSVRADYAVGSNVPVANRDLFPWTDADEVRVDRARNAKREATEFAEALEALRLALDERNSTPVSVKRDSRGETVELTLRLSAPSARDLLAILRRASNGWDLGYDALGLVGLLDGLRAAVPFGSPEFAALSAARPALEALDAKDEPVAPPALLDEPKASEPTVVDALLAKTDEGDANRARLSSAIRDLAAEAVAKRDAATKSGGTTEAVAAEVERLCLSALSCARSLELDRAVWRLVDAAGLAATVADGWRKRLAGCGEREATGRSFFLGSTDAATTGGVK